MTNHTTKHRHRGQPLVREVAPSKPDVLARNVRESARTVAYLIEDVYPNLTLGQRANVEGAVKRAVVALCDVCEAVAHV